MSTSDTPLDTLIGLARDARDQAGRSLASERQGERQEQWQREQSAERQG